MSRKTEINIKGKSYNLNNPKRLFLISGPCVVESEKLCMRIAKSVSVIADELGMPYIFKASYKKANRTSGESFRTIGMQKSLEILGNVREKLGIPVLTDVHSEIETAIAQDYVDVLQIPAFLSRQTELLEAAGETGKIINIKKAQFMSAEDFLFQIKKVEATGNRKILVTERGTMFGYNNLVVDFRSLITLRKSGYPVIYDATHSIQRPSGNKGKSGGEPEFIEPLAKAAVSVGVNGIFIEVHPEPKNALSDAGSMLKLSKLKGLLATLKKLHTVSG